jgi:hypothetical protein
MSIITVDFDGTLYQYNSVITTLKVGKTMFTLKQWLCVIKDIVKGIANKTTGSSHEGLSITFHNTIIFGFLLNFIS